MGEEYYSEQKVGISLKCTILFTFLYYNNWYEWVALNEYKKIECHNIAAAWKKCISLLLSDDIL